MALAKKPLPGEHGDSLDYPMINRFLISFGVGLVIGIVLFTLVF